MPEARLGSDRHPKEKTDEKAREQLRLRQTPRGSSPRSAGGGDSGKESVSSH